MSEVIIKTDRTCSDPIRLIGEMAGVCYGADTEDEAKNFKRGMNCIKSQHGRTFEFPDIYMVLEGYSARVIREFYTHIGGSPTRLQSSTRYIDYAKKGFDYIIPESIKNIPEALARYKALMQIIRETGQQLEELGAPKEDVANILPLGMTTTVVCKINLRTLIDMSHQRKCKRAYWEFRNLFSDIENALSAYSPEWNYIVQTYFVPKCKYLGHCPEEHPCTEDNKEK